MDEEMSELINSLINNVQSDFFVQSHDIFSV